MTEDRPVSPPSELTAEEEAGVRQMLWEHRLAYANTTSEDGVESWADIAERLLATLDAARAAPQADAGTCARCGERVSLNSDDGTCWPCSVKYRDEIIEEYRAAPQADADWRWQCAGCHRPTPPMGMCETCGVFGVYALVAAGSNHTLTLALDPAAPAGLDVERLAWAWGNVMDGRHIPGHVTRISHDTTTAEDWQNIVAEYAALASPRSEDGPAE